MKLIYDLIGLPIDQAKFLICEFISLFIGIIFRILLKPGPKNVYKRQIVSIAIGLALGFFCFNQDFFHIILASVISYLFMVIIPRTHSHLAVFIFLMAYLSCIHLYFQIYHYGEKNFDITSPMMILVQKLTYLAFSYNDGVHDQEKLNTFQKTYALKKLPTIVEFSSYIFNFQGVVVGPSCIYQDYQDFITGNNILKHQKNSDSKIKYSYSDLNVGKVLLMKCIRVFILILIFLNFTSQLPLRSNLEPTVLNKPIWYRFFYFNLSANSGRIYFYTAWTLTEAVHIASGFGFNGFDENGEPKWNLLENVNIEALEKSTNIKGIIDNWNIQTSKWLRVIAFERLPKGKTLGVFFLSAMWHGFYPGYYITFGVCSCLVYIGRGIRRTIRPIFLKNKYRFAFYDVICWIFNRFAINYATAPFLLLDFKSSFQFFNSWYWCIHVAIVFFALVLPRSSFKSRPIK